MQDIKRVELSTNFVKHIASSSLVHAHFQTERVYAEAFDKANAQEFAVIGTIENIENGIFHALENNENMNSLTLDIVIDGDIDTELTNFFGRDLSFAFSEENDQDVVTFIFPNSMLAEMIRYLNRFYAPTACPSEQLGYLALITKTN